MLCFPSIKFTLPCYAHAADDTGKGLSPFFRVIPCTVWHGMAWHGMAWHHAIVRSEDQAWWHMTTQHGTTNQTTPTKALVKRPMGESDNVQWVVVKRPMGVVQGGRITVESRDIRRRRITCDVVLSISTTQTSDPLGKDRA